MVYSDFLVTLLDKGSYSFLNCKAQNSVVAEKMGKRRGRTGPGGAVVSSLSQNPGGKVAARRGQSSGQTEKRRAGNQKGEDEELNKLADLPSNRGAISGSSLSNDGVNRAGQSSSSSGWLGKSPQQMLREWCLKNSRKRPSYVSTSLSF